MKPALTVERLEPFVLEAMAFLKIDGDWRALAQSILSISIRPLDSPDAARCWRPIFVQSRTSGWNTTGAKLNDIWTAALALMSLLPLNVGVWRH